MNDEVDEAVRKVVAAVDRQMKQSLTELVNTGWRARDAVVTAAHDLADAYKRAASREPT